MSALRQVLVVDDDAVVGKSFTRVLSKKGYVVTTAKNAHEALKQVREQSFDVVFTDIKMPGMDGVELAEEVRARQPWTPVVIITGYGTSENETRAKAAGVTDFMRKPLSPEMIEASAAHAMLAPVAPMAARLEVVRAPDVHVDVAAPEAEPSTHTLRNVALLLAAPLIGLAYAVAMPLVGLAALLWMGGKALLQTQVAKQAPTFLKNVALLAAAPFIGLVYAMAMPFVGMGFLVFTAAKALGASRFAPQVNAFLGYAAKFIAAPFVGLAFAVLLPLIGTGMLLWVGGKALMTSAEVA